MLLVRTNGRQLRAMKVTRLNYMSLVTLITGVAGDDLRKSAEAGWPIPYAICDGWEVAVDSWRAACEADGFTGEVEYP